MLENIKEFFQVKLHAKLPFAPDLLVNMILMFSLLMVAFLIEFLMQKVLAKKLNNFLSNAQNKTKWDVAILDFRLIPHTAQLFSPLLIYFTVPILFTDSMQIIRIIQLIAALYLVWVSADLLLALISALESYYSSRQSIGHLPVKSTAQLSKIFVVLIAILTVLASILDKSPVYLLSGIGAFTAIFFVIFRDTILGFISGLQISANDLVRKRDWIEMKKYDADGEVLEVGLTTVKIQNWDKTISTIPTHALVNDAFKNWRGMEESDGRRIKRCFYIDISSIAFITNEHIRIFKKNELLAQYLEEMDLVKISTSNIHNHENLTNLGLFRAYLERYLRHHPMLNEQMQSLVRHLDADEHGLPIEIYVFCRDKSWVNFERIQSQIFEHIYASLKLFNLYIYQSPSGRDILTKNK